MGWRGDNARDQEQREDDRAIIAAMSWRDWLAYQLTTWVTLLAIFGTIAAIGLRGILW